MTPARVVALIATVIALAANAGTSIADRDCARAGRSSMTISPGFTVVSAIGRYKYGGPLSAAQQWRAGVLTFFRA
jgi:hypothetical protein